VHVIAPDHEVAATGRVGKMRKPRAQPRMRMPEQQPYPDVPEAPVEVQ